MMVKKGLVKTKLVNHLVIMFVVVLYFITCMYFMDGNMCIDQLEPIYIFYDMKW